MGLSWRVSPCPLLGWRDMGADESSIPHASEIVYDGLGKGID